MATKTLFVSDLTNKELDEKQAVRITVTDKANGATYVCDAARDEPEVKKLMEAGKKQAIRGRKESAK